MCPDGISPLAETAICTDFSGKNSSARRQTILPLPVSVPLQTSGQKVNNGRLRVPVPWYCKDIRQLDKFSHPQACHLMKKSFSALHFLMPRSKIFLNNSQNTVTI
ncbi:MAG TPA: hypothetical protein PLN94_01015 [Thiolinea sp.]|nr:hypothetical protein [Thiolinea sp.]